MTVQQKKKKTVILVVVIAIFSLVVIGGAIFFFAQNNSKKTLTDKSPVIEEEKKFRLEWGAANPHYCVFNNWKQNKGFKISKNHPALKGIKLKDRDFYLVEGLEKFSFGPLASKNEISMSNKITITPTTPYSDW